MVWCACVCVCDKWFLFLTLKYLSFYFGYLWKYIFWNRSKINIFSAHCVSVFSVWEVPLLSLANILMSWERGICKCYVKELPNHILTHMRFFFFCVLGVRNIKGLLRAQRIIKGEAFYNPAGNYMFKVNNKNTRKRCEMCSKLTSYLFC